MRLRLFTVIVAAFAVLALPPGAQARDRDHDRIPDKWEKRHHLSTKHKSAGKDADRDRVDNWNEWREGTNPKRRDSDRDGRRDGREDRDRDGLNNAGEDKTGNDPIDEDSDDDGVEDGDEQAGVVSKIDGDMLTIDLAGGGSVIGRVTDATEIECESENEAEAENETEHGDGHGDDGPSERSRKAGDDPGDDDGEHDDGEHEDGEHGDGHHGDDEDECPAGALKKGARVHEAELKVTPDGAIFEKIELLG